MKTVTIPFDLEMAKKIQSGEVEGKILDDYKTEYEIIKYDAKGNYPMIGVYFNEENNTSHAPLQEWCKSPYINEPDVGEEILETIRKKRGEWVILTSIDKYMKIDDNLLNNIAKILVNRLDESNSNIKDFFDRNFVKLSDETQKLLFHLVTTDDNHYKTFNFNKLSPTSKVKYLDTLLIHEAFEVARKHMNPEEAVNYIIKRHEQEKNNPPLPTC